MAKRSASDAGLEAGPSEPIAADATGPAAVVDRRCLLDIIYSWEEQSRHFKSNDPWFLESSSYLFAMLRSYLTYPNVPSHYLLRYSNEDVELLQKEMTTEMSQEWNDDTHLRILKITNLIASNKDREMDNCAEEEAEEEAKKRAKRWPEDCRGCGCGSKKYSSCYEGFEDSEDSEDFEDSEGSAEEEANERAKRWPEDCRGCGCGSKRCSSCYEGFEDSEDSNDFENSESFEDSEDSEDPENPEVNEGLEDPEDSKDPGESEG